MIIDFASPVRIGKTTKAISLLNAEIKRLRNALGVFKAMYQSSTEGHNLEFCQCKYCCGMRVIDTALSGKE